MTEADAAQRPQELTERYGKRDGETLLAPFIETEFSGRIALVSSFGAETAVLLHMAAEIDRALPVIFIDTGKIFGETLRYRDQLVSRLGLMNLQVLKPETTGLAARDPDGMLWHANPDACCAIRKVEPLAGALRDYDAWVSGRKQFHGELRAFMPVIEASGNKIKLNPLAQWSKARIEEAFTARNLPRHPLEADGFLSIGCMPCTDRVIPEASLRAGRWVGRAKTECGIHDRVFCEQLP